MLKIFVFDIETREDENNEVVGKVEHFIYANDLSEAYVKAIKLCRDVGPFFTQFAVFKFQGLPA